MKLFTVVLLWIVIIFLPISVFSSVNHDEQYKAILNRILEKISAFKNQYPHFSEFDRNKRITNQKADGMGVTLMYENGVKIIPCMQFPCIPSRSYSQQDGIFLGLIITKHKEKNDRVMPKPVQIGELYISATVEGAKTKVIEEIRQRVINIIQSEKKNFEESLAKQKNL